MRELALFLLSLLLASPSFAAGFEGVRCEHPEVQKILRESLGKMKIEGGGGYGASTFGIDLQDVSNLKTVRATRNKLECTFMLKQSYAGAVETTRARIIYTMFGDGEVSAQMLVGS